MLSRGHPVLPRLSAGYPGPQGRYPRLTAPYAGSTHCWAFPRLACLIHAANVRSEPGSNPSRVFVTRPPREARPVSLSIQPPAEPTGHHRISRTDADRAATQRPIPNHTTPTHTCQRSVRDVSASHPPLRVFRVARPGVTGSNLYYAGDDLLSRWTHYHRPRVLIGRVRDGNGSFHPGMVTGNLGAGDHIPLGMGIPRVYGGSVVCGAVSCVCLQSVGHRGPCPPVSGGGAVRPNGRLLVPVG